MNPGVGLTNTPADQASREKRRHENSQHRIITTHAGSLPRSDDLIELTARAPGRRIARRRPAIRRSLPRRCRMWCGRQRECGIDLAGRRRIRQGDGTARSTTARGGAIRSRAWAGCGLSGDYHVLACRRSGPGRGCADRLPATGATATCFPAAYADPDSGVSSNRTAVPGMRLPVCIDKLTYIGHAAIARRHRAFQGGVAGGRRRGGFHDVDRAGQLRHDRQRILQDRGRVHSTPAPTRCAKNTRRSSMRGLVLQLDDPSIAENWDQINPAPTVEEYRKFTMIRVEALNHAIKGLPRGPHPLPSVLGKLARPARHRHPDARYRRRDAGDRRARVFVRGWQRAA